MRMTRARIRVMALMLRRGRVYVEGGFGGNAPKWEVYEQAFAQRQTMNCLLRAGMVEPAASFNAFQLTAAGKQRFLDWSRLSVERGKRDERGVRLAEGPGVD